MNLVFPRPGYKIKGRKCLITPDINVAMFTKIHIPTNPPWIREMPKTELRKLDVLSQKCSSKGQVKVSLHGLPNDRKLYEFALQGEQHHALDFKCLFNKYLKGYEFDIKPTFSRLTWISNIFYDTMGNQAGAKRCCKQYASSAIIKKPDQLRM